MKVFLNKKEQRGSFFMEMIFHYLAGCLRGLQNYGKKKLEKIFKNDRVWNSMTGVEHQKFGKWIKANADLLL